MLFIAVLAFLTGYLICLKGQTKNETEPQQNGFGGRTKIALFRVGLLIVFGKIALHIQDIQG